MDGNRGDLDHLLSKPNRRYMRSGDIPEGLHAKGTTAGEGANASPALFKGQEMRIKAEEILGRELQPGDLFSTYGLEYWATAMDRGSIGERVYIRTNTSTPRAPDADEKVYRLTIEREGMEKALRTIASWDCENFTSGIGSCYENDRTPDAEFTADRCCAPCIADKGLKSHADD